MSDALLPPPPARGGRRLFQPGQSGNPAGRRARPPKQGEAATIAGVYETFPRTAGIAREKVVRGCLLQILTDRDDCDP
jgi:hypothetical protein